MKVPTPTQASRKKLALKAEERVSRKAEAHFKSGLLIRGEVAAADGSSLAPGQTHVMEEQPDGTTAPIRRRFSTV